jgi:Holliday junction resolvasome RuvABC DNA-binding subunit
MRIKTSILLLVCLLACTGCGRKSTDQLIGDLSSGNERDRIIAARLLQHREEDASKVVPALIKALTGKQGADVRWSAAIGLGYFHEQAKEAIPALEKAEHDRDARVRIAARVALSRIDPNQFPPSTARLPRGK